ncbi:hypothetical protein NKJ09_22970 [Mesorhizobium sp. M0189]|uniref:hypothetical protein n=1 Tax=Mesorhizobium sp. M0189 TaxID=2956909 RepID=UPI00333AEA4E
MYVMEYRGHHCTLHEWKAADLRIAQALKNAHFEYETVSAARARQYVLDGGHHSTPLYIDINEFGKRTVRYARDGI